MKKASRILVGIKSQEEAARLTDLACRIGAHGADLFLIHVIELPDITPLDAEIPELETKAEGIIKMARRVAQGSRMKVHTLIARAHSAGAALLEEAKDNRIDLLVLGSHRRKSLGELFFGTTHEYLARHARCDVLMHVPAKAVTKTA